METYTVVVTDNNGCTDTTSVLIDIFIPCLEVFIPTMFSPNGDGVNDVWSVIGSCINRIETTVYNQWGQMIFQSFNQGNGWDGTYQGSVVPNDQYVYVINVTYDNGTTETFSGFVSVVN